jgi:hypothetical protein
MFTLWQWRSCVIIPISLQSKADAYAAQLDPDTGGGVTFMGVRLSANGAEPASHTMAIIPVTATLVAKMDGLYNSGVLPGMKYWRWQFDTETLIASSSITANIGAVWGVIQSLTDAGLSVISAGG